MILVIKKDGSLVLFKMGSASDEKNYIKKFNEISDECSINLKEKGKHKKAGIYVLFWVRDEEHAKEKTMEFFAFMRKVFKCK